MARGIEQFKLMLLLYGNLFPSSPSPPLLSIPGKLGATRKVENCSKIYYLLSAPSNCKAEWFHQLWRQMKEGEGEKAVWEERRKMVTGNAITCKVQVGCILL